MKPVVAVVPWDGLVHGQQVVVGGLGFRPNSQIGFAECEAGATGIEGCDLATSGYTTANALGGFLGRVTVRRVIRTGSGTVDCVNPPGACEVGAANLADFSESGTVRIRFDPSVPPPPPPTATVTPRTGLVHLQQVTVTGSGFAPHDQIQVLECKAGDNPCNTTNNTYLQTDGTGAFSATLAVQRVVGNLGGPFTDCTASPGACVIRAASFNDPLAAANVALTFANLPPPPAPHLTVTPNGILANNQLVTVNGSSFGPNLEVEVIECSATSTLTDYQCIFSTERSVHSDTHSAFTTPFTVQRFIRGFNGSVDCANPGTCIIAAYSYEDLLATAATTITVGPDAPPTPPSLQVAPSTGLANGQQVTVTGSGYSPGAWVGISQCPTGASSSSDCDLIVGQIASADAPGAFSTTLIVQTVIHTAKGTVDCHAASACVLRAVNLFDFTQAAQQPLSFATTTSRAK